MFDGLLLTNAGSAILTALLSGHTVKFTKIKMGDGNAPADIKTLTDLVSVKQSLPVARSSQIDFETVLIGANLMGSQITEGFSWKEIGVFAQDVTAGTAEVLFSYSNTDTPTYIPEGGTVAEMLIDLNMKVGNATNVDITIDASLIFPTQEDLNTAITGVTTDYTTKIGTVQTNLTNHINNTNNPHSTTKAQVGLGSVENYGIATAAEAQAGTSNAKYMTPARVLDEITAKSVITAGNINIVVGGSQPSPISGKTIIWIDTSS